MWHLSLEKGMFRLASFIALACVTVAATALLSTPTKRAQAQPQNDNDRNAEAGDRLMARRTPSTVPFHARFSLN